jgi:FtsZ-interacting cell division protein ZipA
MRLKVVLILGVLAVIALVVAGCGGGGSSTASTAASNRPSDAKTAKNEASGKSQPMSKAEFHTRINEICIQVPPTYEEELEKLETGGKKLSKSESNLKAAVPPLHGAIEQMETVTPPPAEEQTLKEVMAALEAAAKGLEEEPTSELSGPQSPFAEFQKLTKEKGFETCSGL